MKSVLTTIALWAAILAVVQCHGADIPHLLMPPARDSRGWIEVRGDGAGTNRLLTLQATANFTDWRTVAVLHRSLIDDDTFHFSDPATPSFDHRYYRAIAQPLYPTNDWKNQVSGGYEPFRQSEWLKFAILTSDPTRVYYADGYRYMFHHDFVAARVEPFLGIAADEFDRISQYNTNRQILLGTLLFPDGVGYGIQFVSQDPLPRELVRDMFKLVESTVVSVLPGRSPRYIPTYEQQSAAQADFEFFSTNGITLSSAADWVSANQCYSVGWALGTLKSFAASNVVAAYADGRLTPDDILLVDAIPAELPHVAGLLTMTPTTANSHVAILAQSYGVPFGYPADAAERARILQLTNREVALQVGPLYDQSIGPILVLPVDPPLDPTSRAELFSIKPPARIAYAPRQRRGSYVEPVDALTPAEIKYYGGKASNYGLLRRVIPSNSLPAVAISFDLWEDFMAQTFAGTSTLGLDISNRLSRFSYPPNVTAFRTELGAIRSLIRNSTIFTPEQEHTITNALRVFNRTRNIRFRSSTNVEDSDSFSGAGLYDSFSGCLADDQDGDAVGPSACDPTETDERGVFRAIRRVFASFYNENAALERLRLGVKEHEVGMAILVHHSTPDEIELANGVATGTWEKPSWSPVPRFDGRLVLQSGAASVANPDGSGNPEEIAVSQFQGSPPGLFQIKGSSLLRLGEYVMQWDEDYTQLAELIFKSAEAYAAMVTNKPSLRLDLEFKKVSPGLLEIKQIREVPKPASTNITPFVLNNPVVLGNWHGYYDDIFMAHILKSRWTLRHPNVQFTESNVTAGFYTEVTIEHLNGTNIQTLTGQLSSFPNASHTVLNVPGDFSARTRDRWTMPTADAMADFQLDTTFLERATSELPFLAITRNLGETPSALELNVTFQRPVLRDSGNAFVTNTATRLYALRPETANDYHEEVTLTASGQGTNISIQTSYWLPFEASSGDCRCPLIRFAESRIEGFTTTPLVLAGYWSQTFNNVHHYNSQEFIFEPRLDPNVTSQQLMELAAADIARIYVHRNGLLNPILMIVGLDGTLRRFSDSDP